jgi:hypothetical protein
MIRFGKKAFKEWLSSKDPNDIVGYAGSGCDCPIATFYKEVMRADNIQVGEYWIDWVNRNGVERERETPTWAKHFIDRVDVTFKNHVKAYRALDQLRGL